MKPLEKYLRSKRVWTKFKNNYDTEFTDKVSLYDCDNINNAFFWEDSPEKHTFWLKLHLGKIAEEYIEKYPKLNKASYRKSVYEKCLINIENADGLCWLIEKYGIGSAECYKEFMTDCPKNKTTGNYWWKYGDISSRQKALRKYIRMCTSSSK